MIPPDFAKLGPLDLIKIGSALVSLVIAGLVGLAGALWVARMVLGG